MWDFSREPVSTYPWGATKLSTTLLLFLRDLNHFLRLGAKRHFWQASGSSSSCSTSTSTTAPPCTPGEGLELLTSPPPPIGDPVLTMALVLVWCYASTSYFSFSSTAVLQTSGVIHDMWLYPSIRLPSYCCYICIFIVEVSRPEVYKGGKGSKARVLSSTCFGNLVLWVLESFFMFWEFRILGT